MWNIIIVFVMFFTNIINCYPIEVTGKNISYYKLTPNEGSGTYNFDYGTHDGSQRSERGFIKSEPGSDKPLLVVTGSFKYPDAKEVFYIADEQGYRIVSKKEVDDLHGKLPNEIIPNTVSSTTISSLVVSPTNLDESSRRIPQSSTRRPQSSPELGTSENVQIPVTESQVIKLNVIQPVPIKPLPCPPGKCSGSRQSKIFKIKPIKFG